MDFHPDFLAGRYRAVVDTLLEAKRLPDGHAVSLVASLSFLGRLEEAEALFTGRKGPSLVPARFFLAIGHTRKSDYKRARQLFAENEEAGANNFWVQQGRVFYAYYTGRFRTALAAAAKARRLALRSGDLFQRALATDAYGQCRVMAGEVHLGLKLLEEARELAERLGNASVAGSIAVSLELHDAELGLSGAAGLAKLESRFSAIGTEDDYSAANVGLELARQYTLRGRFGHAARQLEGVAPSIYAQQNRRQEITLNLRLAELAFQRGDLFGARHFLRFLDRLLHREADATFELAALGLKRKIALAESRDAEASELLARARELARDFGLTRDDNLRVRLGDLPPERENREDKIHCALQAARHLATLPEKLRVLLEAGLFAEAARLAGLAPGAEGLAVLPQGLGLLSRDSTGISWQSAPLSSLSAKLLRRLTDGGCDKEALVRDVWGYRYDQLRHDPMVYTALSALRRALGPAAGAWLEATEDGYRFRASVKWLVVESPVQQTTNAATAPTPTARPAVVDPLLNHRQLEILDWLAASGKRFVAVGECRVRFDVSEVTALRDLDGLRKRGLLVRTGRARATRYSLLDGVT